MFKDIDRMSRFEIFQTYISTPESAEAVQIAIYGQPMPGIGLSHATDREVREAVKKLLADKTAVDT